MANNFWSNRSLEPKRQFRFLVSFEPQPGVQLDFAAKSVDRPSYTIGESEHQFFNHTFYYPGRVTWNTVTLTLVDAVTPSSTEALYEYLASIGIADPVGRTQADVQATTITKASATSVLTQFLIKELGNVSDSSNATAVLGQWELVNPFITEVNFGSHDYASDEMVEITVTLRYDWARYEALNTPL